MDAPDNESLQGIEQVNDHSELASLYPNAHNAWEGTDLLSQEAREEKRAQEQLSMKLGVRKWFAVIGLLTPLPYIIGAILFSVGVVYLKIDNLAVLLLPIVAAFSLWVYISFRAIKYVHNILYQHSIQAAPFVTTLILMLVFSMQALYVTMLDFYQDSLIYNSIVTSVLVLALSVAYSGILVFVWTAQKLSGAYKIGCIGILIGIIGLITMLVNVF